MESTTSSSLEVFPIVLGFVLVACNVAFTVFTLWILIKKRLENNELNLQEEAPAETDEAPDASGEDNKDKRMGGMGKQSSWVFGRVVSKRLSAANFATSLNEIQEDEDANDIEQDEEEAIMSWKDVSCSYPSKRKGEPDITTLSNVTGHVKYKELGE